MSNFFESTKLYKFLGTILTIFSISYFLTSVFRSLQYASYDIWDLLYDFRILSLVFIGIILIVPFFTSKRNIYIPIALLVFAGCALIPEIIIIFKNDNNYDIWSKMSNYLYTLINVFIVFIGVLWLKKNHIKHIAKMVFILLIFILSVYIFASFSRFFYNGFFYVFRDLTYNLPFDSMGIVLFFTINIVLLLEKDNRNSKIVLSADVIDFKLLLEFLEEQYKLNKITEEEYKLKRAEIISKL